MKLVADKYNAGEIIKILREWTELTQEQFGEAIGKSKSAIRAYENNRYCYNMDTILKIAEEFDITVTFEKKSYKE